MTRTLSLLLSTLFLLPAMSCKKDGSADSGSVDPAPQEESAEDAGLDPEDIIGELARSTGRHDRVEDADIAARAAERRRTGRWPLAAVGVAVAAFLLWWFLR